MQNYTNGPGRDINKQAQLASAYQELGKELASEKLKVIGGYTIGRMIGEGSFGAVHIATHRLTGTRCAIKKIPKNLSSQITREIHHHRRLHHLHIVQLYEIIATESHIWLVTELCSGGELFDYLVERGRMLEGEARRLFGELTVAVGYMHNEGVVHRDLKLENVLLDGELRVKLADLGFAREWSRGKLMETFCGTTGYASPEMLSGKKYLGIETDIWSLGIILYILLCGGLPFDDDDERVMKNLIIKGEYEEPEWLSEEARSLIRSLLNQNPSDRPSIETIFAHPWFNMTIVDTLPGNHSMPPSPHPLTPLHTDESRFAEPWGKAHLELPPAVQQESPMGTPGIKPAPSSVPESEPSASETSFDFQDSDRGRSSGVTTPTTLEDESADVKRVHSGEFSHTEKALELLHSNTSQSTIRKPIESPTSIHGSVKSKVAVATPLAGQKEVDEDALDGEHHRPRETSITFDDHSLHLPVAQSSRTPSRTKGRSVSSTLSLERRMSHHSTSGQYQTYPPEDYLSMLRAQRPAMFTTPSEKFLLHQLNDLGFDIGQIKHSVENDACDSAASNWWILRAKQVERGETDEIISARQASSARKREKLAAYAREERRKARERGEEVSRDPSPDMKTPGATVAFTDEAKLSPRPPQDGYHLAPPVLAKTASTSSEASTVRLPPNKMDIPIIRQPTTSTPSTPTKDISSNRSAELLASPTESSPREKAGKTRSPSMSMLQRATSAFLGGTKGEDKDKDVPRERAQSEDPDKRDPRSTSPTKLIKPHPIRGISTSQSDPTFLSAANASPIATSPSRSPPGRTPEAREHAPISFEQKQSEAGPSRLPMLHAPPMAAGPSAASTAASAQTNDSKKGPKRDSMWTSWSSFRQFFDQGGQRRKRRDGSPLRVEGKAPPTIVLSRGIAARTPHVNRISVQAPSSRRASLDGRPPLYSRRSSSVNSRRSSVTSIQLPSDFAVRISSYDNLAPLGRRASHRSHGSQTPTSDREQPSYEFPTHPDSASGRRHRSGGEVREMRSPSMQSDSSGRFTSRQPASPLHNYQRRPPQGTASKRIRHIRVIPESQVIRSGSVASSIKSNQSSRASSVDGRREDSDYDTASGREDASLRSKRRRSDGPGNESLARQIHRKGSPLVNQQNYNRVSAHDRERPKVTLKPRTALRDVFQGKDDEWEDEDEFAGGYGQSGSGGQGAGTGATGNRWINGFRAASFPATSAGPSRNDGKKKRNNKQGNNGNDNIDDGSNAGSGTKSVDRAVVGTVTGRRGIPAARGAPLPIAEEEEEEEEE